VAVLRSPGGTAPAERRQRKLTQNFLSDVTCDHPKKVLQIASLMSPNQKVQVVPADRGFVDPNVKPAAGFADDPQDQRAVPATGQRRSW